MIDKFPPNGEWKTGEIREEEFETSNDNHQKISTKIDFGVRYLMSRLDFIHWTFQMLDMKYRAQKIPLSWFPSILR